MKRFFEKLFLFESFKIQTKISKKEILRRVYFFANPDFGDYYGRVSEDGFLIWEKNLKHKSLGPIMASRSYNSFAPVAKAKITEEDGITTVSGVLRMNIILMIIFMPIYIASLITVLLFPFMYIFMHIAFSVPAKRLRKKLEDMLKES